MRHIHRFNQNIMDNKQKNSADFKPVYDCQVILHDGKTFDVVVDDGGLRLFLTDQRVSHVVVRLFYYL